MGTFTSVNTDYIVANSITVTSNATTAWTPYQVYGAYVPTAQVQFTPTYTPPDSPEAWLRRRVKEVCEMANAA